MNPKPRHVIVMEIGPYSKLRKRLQQNVNADGRLIEELFKPDESNMVCTDQFKYNVKSMCELHIPLLENCVVCSAAPCILKSHRTSILL